MYGGNYNPNLNFSSPYYNPAPTVSTPSPIRPPAPANPMIPGRHITNPAEIKPNEVPMDGSVSFFPTNDGNYIYAKCWNSDGTIITAKYSRVNEPEPTPEPSVTNKDILDRLEQIEKLVQTLL